MSVSRTMKIMAASLRTHVHRGFGVAPNQVEAKSVMVERWGDRETWAAGSPPMKLMTSVKGSADGTAPH